jgi:phosphoglycolate phosphatase-like HAD superfamily hydrolase
VTDYSLEISESWGDNGFGAGPQKLGNIASDRVIAVGDTRYDAEAAGKINVRTIRTIWILVWRWKSRGITPGRLYRHVQGPCRLA